MYGKTEAGVGKPVLVDSNGKLITKPDGGRYYRSAAAGNIYTLTHHLTTTAIAAGHLAAAAAAANVQFIVWNPIGSGVNLSLLRLAINITSGTTPISGVYHAVGAVAPTIATGTLASEAVITSHKASVASYDGKAGYYTHTSGGASTGAAAARIVQGVGLNFSAGTFADLAGTMIVDNIDGSIVLPPNTFYVPQWSAAGTSMLVGYSLTWEEVEA
jgi:hypothetical protein